MSYRIFRKLLANCISRNLFYSLWNKIDCIARIGMGDVGAFVDTSGEKSVIKMIPPNNEKIVIFDVGANVGNYARMVLDNIGVGGGEKQSNVFIHCFEPSKKTFETLSKNIPGNENVILNNFGIGDSENEVTLYSDSECSGCASIYKGASANSQHFSESSNILNHNETIKINTIDNYCSQNNISSIDLLKMDIEGNELNALIGAENMLKLNAIKIIQFEFGGCNVYSRTYFIDFWNLLSPDFRIYRLLVHGFVEITKYSTELEVFNCMNYVAIRKDIGIIHHKKLKNINFL